MKEVQRSSSHEDERTHIFTMQIRGEHDDRIGENVGRISTGEDSHSKSDEALEEIRKKRPMALRRIAFAESRRELLHDSIDLLRFARQSKTREQLSQGSEKVHLDEIQLVDVGIHDLLVIGIFFSETIANHRLIEQVLIGVKELSHFLWLVVKKVLLDEILQAFPRMLIEQIHALLEQFLALANHFEIVDVLRQLRGDDGTAGVRSTNSTTDITRGRLIAVSIVAVLGQRFRIRT